MHRVLEDAGIKLATVVTDLMGVSGRAMLPALLDGTTDPAVLAELARGRLRSKLPALREALRGRARPHHTFLIAQVLSKLDFLEPDRHADPGNRSASPPFRSGPGPAGHDSWH